MKVVNLQVRIPDTLKRDANAVFEEIGVDMGTAIKMYLKKVIKTRSIPFSLEAQSDNTLEYVPVDDETQNLMNRVSLTLNKSLKRKKK